MWSLETGELLGDTKLNQVTFEQVEPFSGGRFVLFSGNRSDLWSHVNEPPEVMKNTPGFLDRMLDKTNILWLDLEARGVHESQIAPELR